MTNIYPVKPYVYYLEHIESGMFYFGYRAANRVPASLDIGIKYFTSCKGITKHNFDEYRVMFWEFEEADCAYREEQNLIWAEWNNPLIINKRVYRPDGLKFQMTGPHSAEARAKISATLKGRKRSAETKAKISAAQKGIPKGPMSAEHKSNISEARANMSAAQKGIPKSEETKARMSAAKKGISKSAAHRANMSAAKKGISTGPWSEARRAAHATRYKK